MTEFDNFTTKWIIGSHIIGILLAFTRFIEPYILKVFMNELKTYFPCFFKNFHNKESSKKPISSFLSSALNVEYVYIIIFGVTEIYNKKNK